MSLRIKTAPGRIFSFLFLETAQGITMNWMRNQLLVRFFHFSRPCYKHAISKVMPGQTPTFLLEEEDSTFFPFVPEGIKSFPFFGARHS